MLVVNVTTTSSRLELCAVTLWSLIHQSVLPDRINLWISKEAFMADEGILELPEWLNELNIIKDLIDIKYTENTGPYRKIFPALKSASDNDILVYADDDVVYGVDWLKTLVDCFLNAGGKYVVASRVRMMKKNIFGKYQSYTRFKICTQSIVVESDFIITGIGGCVLKKNHINSSFISNKDYIDVAPKTDDLWISKILILSGSAVLICPDAFNSVQEINHSYFSLNHANVFRLKGTGFTRFFSKCKVKILGYFGFVLSNNDSARIKINDYFDN